MEYTPTATFRKKQSTAATLLVIVAVFTVISWALFGVLIHLILKKYDEYDAALQAWRLAGRPGPNYRSSDFYVPEPSRTIPFTLARTLPPLVLASSTVPTCLVLALQKRLHPAMLLSVAMPSLCLWLGLGIFNAMAEDPYWSEKLNLETVDRVAQGVAAVRNLTLLDPPDSPRVGI